MTIVGNEMNIRTDIQFDNNCRKLMMATTKLTMQYSMQKSQW